MIFSMHCLPERSDCVSFAWLVVCLSMMSCLHVSHLSIPLVCFVLVLFLFPVVCSCPFVFLLLCSLLPFFLDCISLRIELRLEFSLSLFVTASTWPPSFFCDCVITNLMCVCVCFMCSLISCSQSLVNSFWECSFFHGDSFVLLVPFQFCLRLSV